MDLVNLRITSSGTDDGFGNVGTFAVPDTRETRFVFRVAGVSVDAPVDATSSDDGIGRVFLAATAGCSTRGGGEILWPAVSAMTGVVSDRRVSGALPRSFAASDAGAMALFVPELMPELIPDCVPACASGFASGANAGGDVTGTETGGASSTAAISRCPVPSDSANHRGGFSWNNPGPMIPSTMSSIAARRRWVLLMVIPVG
jgi:hypothetical protein